MPFCSKCGTEVSEDASFCPNCGQTLSVSAATSVPHASKPYETVAQRPAGITIIAILEVLGGLVFLGLGTLMILIAGILGTAIQPTNFPVLGGIIGIVLGILGGILILISIANFIIAYGYWNGRNWAWSIGIAFAVLGIIFGLIALPGGIIRILLDLLIIYYLTRPYVKSFFGK